MTQPTLIIPPISPAASGALYEQIVEGFKKEISSGRLVPGTALPSFRALAEELLVSVITVKRAYEELERAGLIFRKQGLGTFVAEGGLDRGRLLNESRARELFEQGIQAAEEAGLSPGETQDLFKTVHSNMRKAQPL